MMLFIIKHIARVVIRRPKYFTFPFVSICFSIFILIASETATRAGRQYFKSALGSLETVLYLKKDIAEVKISEMKNELAKTGYFVDIRFVSGKTAIDDLQKAMAGRIPESDTLSEFPDSIRAVPADYATDAATMEAGLSSVKSHYSEIEDMSFDKTLFAGLQKYKRYADIGFNACYILVVILVIILQFFSLRAMYSCRTDELSVLRLLGMERDSFTFMKMFESIIIYLSGAVIMLPVLWFISHICFNDQASQTMVITSADFPILAGTVFLCILLGTLLVKTDEVSIREGNK